MSSDCFLNILRGSKDFLYTFNVIFESFIGFEKINICDASEGILEFLLIWSKSCWFLLVFKIDRLFIYGCPDQIKQGKCVGGHKSNFCRADFYLKAYFLKKWNFRACIAQKLLENVPIKQFSSKNFFKKIENFHFLKIGSNHPRRVEDGSWACSRSGSVPERSWNSHSKNWKFFENRLLRSKNRIFMIRNKSDRKKHDFRSDSKSIGSLSIDAQIKLSKESV